MKLMAATPDLRDTLPYACFAKSGVLSQYLEEGDIITLRDVESPALTRTCEVKHVNRVGDAFHRGYVVTVEHFNDAVTATITTDVYIPRGTLVELS